MSTEVTTPSEHIATEEEPGILNRFLEGVGSPFTTVAREIKGLSWTFGMTMYYAARHPIRWREVIRQCFEIGNRSVFFVSIVMGFFGLIMVLQTATQSERLLGDLSMLGALFLQLLFREFGPVITGAMIGIRVGTGLAAEIGSMVVTEQVDALRMNDAHPIQYLIVPRMLACIVMGFMLTVIASLLSFLASMAGAYAFFNIHPTSYYNPILLVPGDLIIFSMKTLAFSTIVPVIGCYAGLSAYGGSEGVGRATTHAVVNATLGIAFTDFALSAFGFVFIY